MMRGHQDKCRCGTSYDETYPRPCRYGFCTELCCNQCSRVKMSAGVVGCKCCNPIMRWLWFPAMNTKKPVPVKPSIGRNRKRHPLRRSMAE